MVQTDERTQSGVDVGDLLAKRNNLQPAVLPVDFVSLVMVEDPANFLLQWLSDHGVPPEVTRLLNHVLFAERYRAIYFENAGMIPEDVNQWTLENLGEIIQLMGKLGYTW